MKKLITIVFFATIVVNIHAQTRTIPASGNPNYYSFAERGRDTLNYLTFTFDDNQTFYQGKPLSLLLGDLEIPVLSCVLSFDKPSSAKIIVLDFISEQEEWKRSLHKGKVTSMIITFQQEIPRLEIDVLKSRLKQTYPNYEGPSRMAYWESLHKAFFGGRIVEKIQVVLYDYSKL